MQEGHGAWTLIHILYHHEAIHWLAVVVRPLRLGTHAIDLPTACRIRQLAGGKYDRSVVAALQREAGGILRIQASFIG